MLLSKNDIEKIQNIGYSINFFVRREKGFLKLKNKGGKCVFHNGKICLIYNNRPDGCKLYPLIFNEEYKKAVFDEECLYKDNFEFNIQDLKKLNNLIIQINSERKIKNVNLI